MKIMNVFSIDKIAKLCHEANKCVCESMGDYSQKHWEETHEDIKRSARAGVESVQRNPDVTAEELHELWMDFKIREGWRYGPNKNLEKKTHPLLKPYNEIPELDRLKDKIFLTIVKILSAWQ